MSKKTHLITVLMIILIWIFAGFTWNITMYKENYNCDDMSCDAENLLEPYLNVKIVRGKNGEGRHMWINVYGLDLEPTYLCLPLPNHFWYNDITTYNDYSQAYK